MPKSLTQYRVFIGSPGGLEEERRRFRVLLDKYSTLHGEPAGVIFHPVGWEDTLGGTGRPQELINEDLRPCDFAVFVFHDRWGSVTGSGSTSGTQEEFALAEKLYHDATLRNIILLFKRVDARQLRDPGPQLAKVLDFQKNIESEKKYLFRQYTDADEFCDTLEGHLARWLRNHTGAPEDSSLGSPAAANPSIKNAARAIGKRDDLPNYDYWIEEAERQQSAPNENFAGSLFCAQKAIADARSPLEWAKASISTARAHLNLGNPTEGYQICCDVLARLDDFKSNESSETATRQELVSRALFGKGAALGKLNRSDEAIAVYDDVVVQFSAAAAVEIGEQVAKSIFNKGVTLGRLGRFDDAIAVYDSLVARFGTTDGLLIRTLIVSALRNKGLASSQLGRKQEAIAAYDEVIRRVGAAADIALRDQLLKSLVNKGYELQALGRNAEALTIYDDVMMRFGPAAEAELQSSIAWAVINKGVIMDNLGRSEESLLLDEQAVARLGALGEADVREPLATALLNKGITLNRLKRTKERDVALDELIARFGSATEPVICDLIKRAKILRK